MTRTLPYRSLFKPTATFHTLSEIEISPRQVLFSYALWLLLLPPTFLWLGGHFFGWRIGANDPMYLPATTRAIASIGYFCLLLFGYFSTAIISRWFAGTYGARTSLGHHFAMVAIVGTPLAVASVAHLFPHIFFNVLVLIPTMIWSMYLLYKGVPIVLQTPPERGMLMSSSLVGWLLVAAVSLLGITVALWAAGIGPILGV
ncbi:Yip1 family protein [Gilvimarinus sp. F26214L]|uniref:Yip1 family protein n=1 Tax=Gilvimarinus sp. DZF01 TaxID=3461371 RepID=UPI0040453E32